VIDEQHFALGAAFANQTLSQIKYHFSGQGGTPILEGVTLRTASAVPEPRTTLVMALGLFGVLAVARRTRLDR
jgi:hypothetical protein